MPSDLIVDNQVVHLRHVPKRHDANNFTRTRIPSWSSTSTYHLLSLSMKISRRIVMGFTGLALAATVAVPVFAASLPASTATPVDPQQSLIQALVQRFHLNQSDVQSFFQDQETAHFNEALTRLGTRLSTDVTQGKLTEAQKNAIIEKAKEAKTKQDSFRTLSQADRDTQMKQYRTDLETWATQQGIDKQYLREILGGHGGPGGPRGGGHGMGGPEGQGMGRGPRQGGPVGQSTPPAVQN